MHILFVHRNFPAQFGHIASHLVSHRGDRCTFISERPAGNVNGIECIQYTTQGGATVKNHYCSRTFENAIWHTDAVFQTLKTRPDIRPDLIVGHSGFGSTLFLRELYGNTPILNYFEYYYHLVNSDMDFRPDFPSSEQNRLRAMARNAMLVLDLENCNLGYSPTTWQRDRFPSRYHDKIKVVFDGVDTTIWHPTDVRDRTIAGHQIPGGKKVVTYATRGMESMRGFDIFMKVAKRLCDRRHDVVFVIAGQDRICYGGDQNVIGQDSFKEWVLSQDQYDLSRFHFVGLVPPIELARLFSLSDLHFYLTVPFVLSWSLMNALACGATVLASNTEPVCEMIRHHENGLLADFFDLDQMTDLAESVLDHPDRYAHVGPAGQKMIQEQYSLDHCLPQLLGVFEEAVQQVL